MKHEVKGPNSFLADKVPNELRVACDSGLGANRLLFGQSICNLRMTERQKNRYRPKPLNEAPSRKESN